MIHGILTKKRLISLLMVLVGNVFYALTVKLFLLPANLMSCGTTGLGLVISHLTGFPLTVFIFCFNMAMLALGWWILGRSFAMSTIISSLFYPVALEILNRILGDVVITQNIMLNVLFSGLGLAGSLGIVLRGGASTGGMDIPPLIIQKYFHIPVSVTLAAFDFCILLTQLLFHTLEDLLYGILLLIVISITLNKVLLLGTSKTEIKIISKHSDEIREAILSRIDRGVTLLHAEGGYRRNETWVILSIVSNHELPKIQRLAREIDPACFMIVNQVSEVWGLGFTTSKHS